MLSRTEFHTIAIVLLTAVPLSAQARDTTAADTARAVVLDPVRVTVTRWDARLARVPQAVTVLDRAEILRGRPAMGLDEALVAVPGLLVANRYNFSLDQLVSIRGFGARSAFGVRGIKVLLDGVPQTLPDGQGQLSNIELSEVDRIEVLRGASSSLYGNASGGVISIWSRAPGSVETPSLRLTAGEFGLLRWKAAAGVAVGQGSGSLSVTRTVTDGFRAHSEADIRQVDARLVQALGARTTLHAGVRVNDSPVLENPGALTRAEADSTPSAADARNVAAGAGKAVTQAQAGVALRHGFAGGGSLDATVFGIRRALENPLAFAFIDLDRWAWGARGAVTLPLAVGSRASLVTAGLDAQWQRDDRLNRDAATRDTVTLDQLERVFEVGPFVQLAVDLVPRATVTLGARYDRVRFEARDRLLDDGADDSGVRVMSAASGSAGVTYEVHEALMPYLSVGTSFETPTTTELANRPDGAGGFNPSLEPQRATNYEIGARGLLGAGLSYAIAGYVTDVRDELIPFEVPGSPNRRFFRNAGSARHSGIELQASARLRDVLTVIAAYTYADHTFEEFRTEADTLDGNRVPGVPRHYGYVSLRYEASWDGWVALDHTLSSTFFVNDDNTARNEAWHTTGVRAGWEGRLEAWRLAPFVGVTNVFDRRYVGSVVVNARGGRYYEPAPGRAVYVGVSIGRR